MARPALAACGLAGLLAGCGGAPAQVASPLLAPGDPVLMLPSSIELVAEVDSGQLAEWPGIGALLAALPEVARARIGSLGFDPIKDTEALAVGATDLGDDAAEWLVAARGRFDRARIGRAASGADGTLEESTYHGVTIADGGARSFALIERVRLVLGGRTPVRRAVDAALGNDEPAVRSAEDRTLFAALGRAPEAKRGRAAARVAVRVGEPLRALLRGAGIDLGPLAWLSGAVAVGDGVDLGVVAGARDTAAGNALQAAIDERLAAWRDDRALKALGLAPFLAEVRTGRRKPRNPGDSDEVHLALRLDQRRWDRLLARLAALPK